jgi:hypothetical protein
MQTVVEVSMVTAIEYALEIVIETVIEAVIEVSMKLSLKLPWKTTLRLSWKLLCSLRSVAEIVVEVAMETASETAMDTALGAVVEIVEYMLALLLVEMILLPSALRMRGFCTGLLGFCVLVVRSRQVVVGRDETCRRVEKVLNGAVFELPDAVVVWSKAGVDFFHFTFHFGFSFCKTLFLITHSVRGVTMSRLDRLQIDC